MNIYNAYFGGRTIEVKAKTAYEAHLAAVAAFHPTRAQRHMVSVVLAAVDGKPVKSDTASL